MKTPGEIYRSYRQKRESNPSPDFVTAIIEAEINAVWDAYMSILVVSKNGNELTPIELTNKLDATTQYLALEEFFEETTETDIYITDDTISLQEEHDLYTLLHAVVGKDVTVHLCVKQENIVLIEKLLKQVAQEEASEIYALIKWKYIDDGYSVQLERRIGKDEHLLRVYPGGKAVLVSLLKDKYKITYVDLPNQQSDKIEQMYLCATRKIIENPTYYSEDDRYWGFSSILWYGLLRLDDNVYEDIAQGKKYELQEFSDDEHSFQIAKALFSIDDVLAAWKEHLRLSEETSD